MLHITIPQLEQWDELHEEFTTLKPVDLVLEHSLVSMSKWEAKWCKPFLSDTEKTVEETIDYIKCMTITQNVNPLVYLRITNEIIQQVNDYIGAPMTATWFNESNLKGSRRQGQQITNELIYYWMIALGIPFKCEKWHLNRLITLIKVCNAESKPKKKVSQRETLSWQAELNAARKKKYNTKG